MMWQEEGYLQPSEQLERELAPLARLWTVLQLPRRRTLFKPFFTTNLGFLFSFPFWLHSLTLLFACGPYT